MKTSAALKSTGYSLTVCMKFYISIPHAPPFVNRGALTFQNFFSLGLRHLPFVDRAHCGALPPFVNRERCGALPPFVNRGALRRFTAVDKRERCGAAIQKRRIRPRFFAKKARAKAKFGWYVLVAVRQKAALFEEAGDIV